MWMRSLAFAGVILGGILGVRAILFPPPIPARVSQFDTTLFTEPDFRTTVSGVNAALAEQLPADKLTPAPRADDWTIARRLSLALTGTIPSLQEIRQLEATSDEHKIKWWLEGLLQDRRSADYLAERFARAFVGTEDGPFLVYRRRRFVSWLSDELLKQRPYDQLVRELIASEGLWTDKPATNFVTVTVEPASRNQPNPERLAGRVARAFLGIRLDCAQCHNHPFEKWRQADFQGLAAFFGQVKEGFTGTYDGAGDLKLENRKTGELEAIAACVPFRPTSYPRSGRASNSPPG